MNGNNFGASNTVVLIRTVFQWSVQQISLRCSNRALDDSTMTISYEPRRTYSNAKPHIAGMVSILFFI